MEKRSILAVRVVMVAAAACLVFPSSSVVMDQPPPWDYPKFARWLMFQSSYGTLTTIATLNTSKYDIAPYSNFVAVTDGPATGIPYMYISTFRDKNGMEGNRTAAALTLSEFYLNRRSSCYDGGLSFNSQNPTCSRATFTGVLQLIDGSEEGDVGKIYLFNDFPTFKSGFAAYPFTQFKVFKIDIKSIVLTNNNTDGAVSVDVDEYFNARIHQ